MVNSTANPTWFHPNLAGLWQKYSEESFVGHLVYLLEFFLWWFKYETYKTDGTNLFTMFDPYWIVALCTTNGTTWRYVSMMKR